jgi:hypothetical protein
MYLLKHVALADSHQRESFHGIEKAREGLLWL